MLTIGNMGEGFTEFTALFLKLRKNKINQDNAYPWGMGSDWKKYKVGF